MRRRLHAQGLRYSVDYPLPFDRRRRADVVFPRLKVAVFVDGCFWHSCPEHGTTPKSNVAYWTPKLARNAQRDIETTSRLESTGWTVLRYWEHDDPDLITDEVAACVARLREMQRLPDR